MNRCIDAGREGCPCVLAESKNCLVCSRLSGGTCQDCTWQGVCVFSLFQQEGQHVAAWRQRRVMDIVECKSYGPDLKVFVLQADRGFCQKAALAGAYVFVKCEEDHDWFGAPISVLKAEPSKGRIHLAVCQCGPKTGRILQQTKALHVRGVYYNALTGQDNLQNNPMETFVFAKGIALAPFRNFLDGGLRYRKFLSNLRLFVDLDKINMDFFLDYFGDLSADVIEIRNFAREGICSLDLLDYLELQCQQGAPINVFALTSPYYAYHIQRAVGFHKGILRPTEGNFCCGEGACGACTSVDDTGKIIRRCKAVL